MSQSDTKKVYKALDKTDIKEINIADKKKPVN